MFRIIRHIFPLILLLAAGCSYQLPAPGNLTCDGMESPLGIDNRFPELSWNMDEVNMRNRSYIYRVVVSSDSLALTRGIYDQWDYEVLNPANLAVRYNGSPLKPRSAYYWQVEVRSNDGKSQRSAVRKFETGQMGSQWHAQWITAPRISAREGAPVFVKTFHLDSVPLDSRGYISCTVPFELTINGSHPFEFPEAGLSDSDRKYDYYVVDTGGLLKPGENTISIMPYADNTAYSGRYLRRSSPLLRAEFRINSGDGSQTAIFTDTSWECVLSQYQFNTTTGFQALGFADNDYGLPAFVTEIQEPVRDSLVSSVQFRPAGHRHHKDVEEFTNLGDTLFFALFADDSQRRIAILPPADSTAVLTLSYSIEESPAVNNGGINDETLRFTNDQDERRADRVNITGGADTLWLKFEYRSYREVRISSDRPLPLRSANIFALDKEKDSLEEAAE